MRRMRKALLYFIVALGLIMLPTIISSMDIHNVTVLVAKEEVAPPFDKALVFIDTKGLLGAFGVILNKPLTAEEYELMPEFIRKAGIKVFYGGPLNFPDGLFVLERREPETSKSGIPFEVTDWYELKVKIPDLAERIAEDQKNGGMLYRVFAGYSGWGPWQYVRETGPNGYWYVISPTFEVLFQKGQEANWEALYEKANSTKRVFLTSNSNPFSP